MTDHFSLKEALRGWPEKIQEWFEMHEGDPLVVLVGLSIDSDGLVEIQLAPMSPKRASALYQVAQKCGCQRLVASYGHGPFHECQLTLTHTRRLL